MDSAAYIGMTAYLKALALAPIGLLVLTASVYGQPEPPTAGVAEHYRALVEAVPTFRLQYSSQAATYGFIPTNTVAFREYALDVLIKQARVLNKKWDLGLPQPLTSDQVTSFAAAPKTNGIDGSIRINNRFIFEMNDGAFAMFSDMEYSSRWWSKKLQVPQSSEHPNLFSVAQDSAKRYDDEMVALSKMTNLLTRETAAQLAEDALHKLGLDEKQLGAVFPAEVKQGLYAPEGRTNTYELPDYQVSWPMKPGGSLGFINIEVSGVTKKVVSYVCFLGPVVPLPTNYYEMLGISPDRRTWGKKYGYNPMDSDEFREFARQFLISQANDLDQKWQLGLKPFITASNVQGVISTPRSNSFSVAAQFASRFYLQFAEGKIELFTDYRDYSGAIPGDEAGMRKLLALPNHANKKSAEALARDYLHRLGFTEKALHLQEPPEVTQLQFAFPNQEKLHDFPFYEVKWHALVNGQASDFETVGFQFSGITKQVTMYGNSVEATPTIPTPTNYLRIIGLGK